MIHHGERVRYLMGEWAVLAQDPLAAATGSAPSVRALRSSPGFAATQAPQLGAALAAAGEPFAKAGRTIIVVATPPHEANSREIPMPALRITPEALPPGRRQRQDRHPGRLFRVRRPRSCRDPARHPGRCSHPSSQLQSSRRSLSSTSRRSGIGSWRSRSSRSGNPWRSTPSCCTSRSAAAAISTASEHPDIRPAFRAVHDPRRGHVGCFLAAASHPEVGSTVRFGQLAGEAETQVVVLGTGA